MIDFIKRKLPYNLRIRKYYGILKGFFAFLKYCLILDGIEIVGITGTDGKTSTTIFTAQLLQNLGIKTAAMSSELYFVNGKFKENKSKRTTASPFEIFKFIKKAKEEGVKKIILEVSSHSLEQGRLFGINFDYSIITNLSQEHLDYHGTIENYAKTKAKIILKTKKSVIIKKNILEKNIFEDAIKKMSPDSGESGLELVEVFIGEGIINKNLFIGNNLRFEKDGTLFDLNYGLEKFSDLKLNVLGAYNVENICFGIALFSKLSPDSKGAGFGVSYENLKNAISKIKKVPGRLDEIDFGQDFKIWISFAVTPQAVEETLKYAKKLAKQSPDSQESGLVYLVFGATGGQHDHGKRPILGEIAGNFADISVLTDDETYGEDSMKIISEVEEGLKKTSGKYKVIQDRGEAIKFALLNAKKGDVVIITGMGTFESRNIGGIEEKWSDKEVCRVFFKK